MQKFMSAGIVVGVALMASATTRAGDHKNSGGSSGNRSDSSSTNNHSDQPSVQSPHFNSPKQNRPMSKPTGVHYDPKNFHYTYQCRSSRYGCDCYWYPKDRCWCVWYEPWCCYVPYTRYVALMTPVAGAPVAAPVAAPAVPPALPDRPPPQL